MKARVEVKGLKVSYEVTEQRRPGPRKSSHTREQLRAHDRVVEARVEAILARKAQTRAA